mgnify:FL=1
MRCLTAPPIRIVVRMKLNSDLLAGVATRGDLGPAAANRSDWIVWAVTDIDAVSEQMLIDAPLFLSPKHATPERLSTSTVLLGVPLGEIAGADLADVDPRHPGDASVAPSAALSLKDVVVIAGADRATVKRAKELLGADRIQFHTTPELFPET